MGRYFNGVMGAVVGTVGTVVGSSWKGKKFLRGKAVRLNKTKTQKQLVQQAKFSVAINFVNKLAKFLEISYRSKADGMTGQNAAMKALLPGAITGTYPNFSLEFTKVKVSPDGDLPNGGAPSASSPNPGALVFNWTNNSGVTLNNTKAEPSDKAMVVAWCPDLQKAIYNTAAAQRSEATANLNVAAFSGLAVHTWIVFISEDQQEISASFYTGLVSID